MGGTNAHLVLEEAPLPRAVPVGGQNVLQISAHSGAALREFKWDKLTEAQPYLEKLPNWKAEFLHTGALTPEGRQRLVEMGYDIIDGKEKAALPHIQQAARRLSVPQLRGMYNGDKARKQTLVDFGFRLPSALDNRPQSFAEFQEVTGQTLSVDGGLFTQPPWAHEPAPEPWRGLLEAASEAGAAEGPGNHNCEFDRNSD
jgi:hypothetical protein